MEDVRHEIVAESEESDADTVFSFMTPIPGEDGPRTYRSMHAVAQSPSIPCVLPM